MIPAFAKGYNKLIRLETLQQLDDLKAKTKDKMIAILFWASWYPECEDIKRLFQDMCIDHSHIKFAWVCVFMFISRVMLTKTKSLSSFLTLSKYLISFSSM